MNTQPVRILLVEDALDVQLIVRAAIGEKFQLTCVATAEEAVRALRTNLYSLIILDIGLPDEDGFKLCANIRFEEAYKRTPIVFLTGNSQTQNKVLAFSLGAEDYVVKPIDPAEFQARIEAKMRRIEEASVERHTFSKGPFRVTHAEQKIYVEVDGREKDLGLSSIEYKLLYYFINHDNHVLSRETILDQVWGSQNHVTDRVVDTCVYSLRKKLGLMGHLIQSVPRVGYKLSLSQAAVAA